MRERHSRSVALAIVLGALVAPSASAHVTVQPTASRPADLQFYSVTVPSERPVDTTRVDLQIPPGFNFVLADETPGWRSTIVRKGDEISEIRWSGGRVRPDHYRTFRFIGRNPVREGPLAWKALQRYADGTVVRWIGAAGSEFPASQTELTEAAVPTDTASVNGEPLPTAVAKGASAASTSKAATTSETSDERDGLTLGIAIGAALLALVAVGLGLRRRSTAE